MSHSTTPPDAGDLTAPHSTTAPADKLVGARLRDRFTVVDVLGAGAHGVVYEAFDEGTKRSVALKALARLGPDGLVRFKQEFRGLSDIVHPNLVALHELFVDDSGAWFTMELVPGTDLISWVRPDPDTFDEHRLRDAFGQLAAGLGALHRAGKLHRDIKPSNVLVRHDGHVLLADFGLAREVGASDHPQGVVGTPAYMSPEQAVDLELTIASDWYAVGTMLFEALTGRPPFEGRGMDVMMAKQAKVPPRPSDRVSHVPPDLDEVCAQLIQREPNDRAGESDVLDVARTASVPVRGDVAASVSKLFGRDDDLRRLEGWLDSTRFLRKHHAVIVRGQSGYGKTALLEVFARRLRRRDDVVVLHSRCYERESVPYKGMDVLIDELRRVLLEERPIDGEPPGAAALSRLFPVLLDVPALRAASTSAAEDPLELRREALLSLRRILHAVAEHRVLVVLLDDLQWCDSDSAEFFGDLIRHMKRPPVLFVAGLRDEDAPIVRGFTSRLGREADVAVEKIVLGPLGPTDMRSLCQALIGGNAEPLVDVVAREAMGSPLFAAELARFIEASPVDGSTPAALPRFDQAVKSRIELLPAVARRMLEVITIAGRPVPQRIVLEATDAGADGLKCAAMLRAGGLVHTTGSPEDPLVMAAHGRIANAIIETLGDDVVRERHACLATALGSAGADPELLATHLQSAGHPDRAIGHFIAAANIARDAVAFRRAARLYRHALALAPGDDPRRPSLLRSLAQALAHDGRGAEAAEAYSQAAALADGDTALELRRQAADQLLRAGRVRAGVEALAGVAAEIGMAFPRAPANATARLAGLRARLRMRGTEFDERPPHESTAAQRLAIDTCWAAASGLLQTDVLVGQYFQARHLLLSLEAGDPRRVARALGMETLYSATAGTRRAIQTQELLDQVWGLGHRLEDPTIAGVAAMAAGIADFYFGRFRDAEPRLEQAEQILNRCTDVTWEMAMTRVFLAGAKFHLGRFDALSSLVERGLADADARDDLQTSLLFRAGFEPLVLAFRGEVEGGRAVLRQCRNRWPEPMNGSTFRYIATLAQARLERYAGRGADAWRPFVRGWPALVRSLMLTQEPFRIFLRHERATSALWAASKASAWTRRSLLAIAAHDARGLAGERPRWSRRMARPLRATLAAAAGERRNACDELKRAQRDFAEAGMVMYAAAAGLRRAQLDAHRGGSAAAEAESMMHEHGASDGLATANMLLPPVVGWPTT